MSLDQDIRGASVDRRTFLKTTTAVAAGLGFAGTLGASAATVERKRVIRIGHLTDVHVYPDRGAPIGMAQCLQHVQALADKPDLILFGGDCVMDAFEQTREHTKLQWDMWKSILKAENSIPFKTCIGNHDIWGWRKSKSKATGSEPDYGKNYAVEILGLPNRYYSFRQAGWHFIALDGVQPAADEAKYSAFLDEQQFDWLEKELDRVPATTPIMIWSHIPIVSAMPMLAKRKEPGAELTVSPGMGHTDAGKIVELLAKHPNAKACLSGHLHVVDHVEIKGIHFHCNGAVCGSWWKGKHEGFEEGYSLLDLYDDGTYTFKYVDYGWNPRPATMNLDE